MSRSERHTAPVRLKIPALGNAEVVGEVELPADLFVSRDSGPYLSDRELRARWKVSARTLKRLRDGKRLPYCEPSPRHYLYLVADLERIESETRTERANLRPIRSARGSR